jgi:hypothetical protein
MAATKRTEPIVERLKGSIPCLCLVCEQEGEYELAVASGCLLQEQGRLFWLTAGHVILNIERLRDSGCVRSAHWQDGHRPSIPAVIDGWERVAVDEKGIDFGIVELPTLHADNMRASARFKAFTLSECLDLGSAEALRLEKDEVGGTAYILGYPKEWAKVTVHSHSPGIAEARVEVKPVEIPLLYAVARAEVERESGPTEDAFWVGRCAYARIPDPQVTRNGAPLETIAGVSGGPVVLDLDGDYRLLGSQTAWLPKSRVVRMLPINFVKAVLLNYLGILGDEGAGTPS